MSEKTYLSIKTSDPNTVRQILNIEDNIEFSRINVLQEYVTIGTPIFLVLGGDRTPWERGLIGIGVISQEPYDIGYEARNFRIKIDAKVILKEPISREELIPYRETYGISDIGPMLKGEANQALKSMTDEQAVALIRAMLEMCPEIYPDIESMFSDLLERIIAPAKKMVEVTVGYNESVEQALEKQFELFKKVKTIVAFSKIFPHNRIIFGAPGTGKSYALNKEKDELLANGGDYERVTFHPDYSYANFVGTYKPVPDEDNPKDITYKYVPGPFMRVLVKALESAMTDTPKPYVLIIEEINRANTAAVFGDVFQLLDRKDGISEYPVQTSQDMRKYLAKELKVSENECAEIRIPANMFIWATMNSADQGVYPMDTAFKRRWDFTYIGIDEEEKYIPDRVFTCKGKAVKWNDIRKAINKVLEKEYGLNEDKLLGPFFISRNVLENADDELFWRTFDNKVLMYLCDDALRHRNGEHLFEDMKTEKLSYAKVHRMFQEKGLGIFNKKILEESNVQTVTDSFAENTNEA